MAVEPVRIHIPIEVSANDTTEFILEDQINVSAVHEPRLLFWNTDTEDVTVQVEFILDFGPTGNVRESGTFIFDVLPPTVVTPSGVQNVPVRDNIEVIMPVDASAPITHRVTITNASASDLIVRFILSGFYEELLHEAVNVFIRRQGLL